MAPVTEILLRILVLLAALAAGLDSASAGMPRPSYRIHAAVDYELLTLKGSAEVSVPNDTRRLCAMPSSIFMPIPAGSSATSGENTSLLTASGLAENPRPFHWTARSCA
jgi:hypothetical protein